MLASTMLHVFPEADPGLLNLLGVSTAFGFLCLGLLGLAVGSFLNVVIHRLPRMLERETDLYLAAWQAEAEARAAASPPFDHPHDAIQSGGYTTSPFAASLAAHLGNGAPPVTAVDPALQDTSPAPARYNLAVPRSTCPQCQTPIAAWDNIPILSWLLLRGRCRQCRTPISARYPLVEALTALLFLAMGARFGFGWALPGALVLCAALLVLSLIDWDHFLLPDEITQPLLWLGLLCNTQGLYGVSLENALLGAVGGYLLLWSVYWVFLLVSGKEGMGQGDFKLLAALGAWLGWSPMLWVLVLASFLGAVVGLSLIAATRHRWSRPLPFGPWLALAGGVVFVFGTRLAPLIEQGLAQLTWLF